MPCNSDYMEATSAEKNLGGIYQLLDELAGKGAPENYPNGYDRRVYGKVSKKLLDKKTEKLCSKLQTTDVSKYSLEMQIWWRDHQIADKKRIEDELNSIEDDAKKQEALSKLTDHEKKLLGLK